MAYLGEIRRIDSSVQQASEMRYAGSGDWWSVGSVLEVRVSDQGDWRNNFVIAIHEMIEAALCVHRGIDEQDVTAFDVAYKGNDEPGDQDAAPYRKEHQFATIIEHLIANELQLDWNEHNGKIEEGD